MLIFKAMFSTFKQRLILAVYIFIILSIPVGAFLASQTQTFKSKASEQNTSVAKSTPKPTTSAVKELLDNSELEVLNDPTPPTPAADSSTPTIATSFGPTLSLKVTLEGRPADDQSTKLFVGIFEGEIKSNPKFLLSFSLDLPKDGTYTNLSLAGLSSGTRYTALLKGSAQIATSSAFIMSPTLTNLNSGQALNMLSGDLNEDNVVNSADLTIAQKGDKNADFNLDGAVNAFDLAIISKNMNQVGASGVWTSPIPKVGTPSTSLDVPTNSSYGGYWLWIPQTN